MSKVVILGLTGLNPMFVQRWLHELPNLAAMQQEGVWGSLESTVPPYGPPVWLSILCGKNSGAFGIWDHFAREGFSYTCTREVDSTLLEERVKCLHHILPKLAQRVALVNVPYTWPPLRIPSGYCLSAAPPRKTPEGGDPGFLAWPEGLAGEIAGLLGDYEPSASLPPGTMDSLQILERLQKGDAQRVSLTKWFLRDKGCDVVLTAFPTIERATTLFLRYEDKRHPHYAPDHPQAGMLRKSYRWVDEQVGEVREAAGSDTTLMVFSPYGSQRSNGTVLLNEWLAANNYLSLREYPDQVSPWSSQDVDWPRTRCWAEGNAGQLYINLAGREAEGAVDPAHYERFLAELSDKLGRLTTQDGTELAAQVTRKEDIHSGPFSENGPDLFVSFDEYRWYTDDRVGHGKGTIVRPSGADEPSEEAHGRFGYFALAGPEVPSKGELPDISTLSIAPTTIDILGMNVPPDMERPPILSLLRDKQAESPAGAEQKVRSRLEALGY
ncbi:MAG: alkaline phosphatase family protein [Spirochaetales bacterium]|nr:alkaline phosphatase family protein [Spirochaetales bacterium]